MSKNYPLLVLKTYDRPGDAATDTDEDEHMNGEDANVENCIFGSDGHWKAFRVEPDDGNAISKNGIFGSPDNWLTFYMPYPEQRKGIDKKKPNPSYDIPQYANSKKQHRKPRIRLQNPISRPIASKAIELYLRNPQAWFEQERIFDKHYGPQRSRIQPKHKPKQEQMSMQEQNSDEESSDEESSDSTDLRRRLMRNRRAVLIN
jgi:hypothetical protein